jgi:tetratricopeptide (TPR) repeat protein
MQAGLQSPLRKLIFSLLCLLLILLFASRAWRTAAAAWAARSLDLAGFQRAASLEPGNAEYRQNIGRYYSLVDLDLEKGLINYQAAASLNPYKARHWLDLALVHQLSGNVEEENRALEHALKAEPTSLNVAWEAANLYVVLGDWEKAFPLLRTVMERDPVLRRQAVEVLVRGDREIGELLERAVPPSVPAYIDLLQLLVRRKDSAGAGAVWERLMAQGGSVPVISAMPYVNLLLVQHQGERARQAWQDLARVSAEIARYVSPGNLVTNGGFEEKILGNGLDWRVQALPGVDVGVDEGQAHSGDRSLRIKLDGADLALLGVGQLVPVQPSTTYRMMIYVRSENLQGLNAPRMQVADAATGVSLFLSDEISGSEPWRSVRGEFTTGPQVHLVILRVIRAPILGQVRGTLWLDSARIEPVSSSAPGTPGP